MNLLGSLMATLKSPAQSQTGTLPASEGAMFGDALPFRLQLASTTAPVVGGEGVATGLPPATAEGPFTLEGAMPRSADDLPGILGLIDRASLSEAIDAQADREQAHAPSDHADDSPSDNGGLVPGLTIPQNETTTAKVEFSVATHALRRSAHAGVATPSVENSDSPAPSTSDIDGEAPAVRSSELPVGSTSRDALARTETPAMARFADPALKAAKAAADAQPNTASEPGLSNSRVETAEAPGTNSAGDPTTRMTEGTPAPFPRTSRVESEARPASPALREGYPVDALSDQTMADDRSQDSTPHREYTPRFTDNGGQPSTQPPRAFADNFDAVMQQPAAPAHQAARAPHAPVDIPVTGSPIPLDQQFGQRLGAAVGAAMSTMTINDGRIRLQVAPDHLGPIDIEFDTSGPTERLSITVENEAVRQAVAQAQGRIDLELRQAGTRLAGIDIAMRDAASDESAAGHNPNGARDNASGQQSGDRRSAQPHAPGPANSGVEMAVDTPHQPSMPGNRPGSIRYA